MVVSHYRLGSSRIDALPGYEKLRGGRKVEFDDVREGDEGAVQGDDHKTEF